MNTSAGAARQERIRRFVERLGVIAFVIMIGGIIFGPLLIYLVTG